MPASAVSYRAFVAATLVGAGLVCAGLALEILPAVSSAAPKDAFVQFLPWVLLSLLAALCLVTSPTVVLMLVGAACSIIARLAGPVLVDQLPNVSMPPVVWLKLESDVSLPWVQDVSDGTPGAAAGSVLIAVGAVTLLASVALAVLALRTLLLRSTPRASFGIDVSVLVTLFGALALGSATAAFVDLDLSLLRGDLWLATRTLAWVVPLVAWLALAARQGGSIGVGAAAGAAAVLLALEPAMNGLASLLGGPSSYFVAPSISSGGLDSFKLTAYEALDPFTYSVAPGILALLLLAVLLWWSFSTPPRVERRLPVTSSDPVNWLAVGAFTLSLVPLTAPAGIVFGHMSYDQISGSDQPLRGIGLSRWAIVLGYLTLLGSAVLWARLATTTGG